MCTGHCWHLPCGVTLTAFVGICQRGEALEQLWLIATECNRESTVTVKIQYCVFIGRNACVSSRHCGLCKLGQWPFAFSPGFPSAAHMLSHFHPLGFAPPPHRSLTTFHPLAFTTLRADQTWLSFSWFSPSPPLRTVSPRQIAVRLVLVRTTENTANCNSARSAIVLSQKLNPEPLFFL